MMARSAAGHHRSMTDRDEPDPTPDWRDYKYRYPTRKPTTPSKYVAMAVITVVALALVPLILLCGEMLVMWAACDPSKGGC